MKEFIARRKWHYLFLWAEATAFSVSWDLDEAHAAETICQGRHYEFLTGEQSLRPPHLTCKIAFSQQAGIQILRELLHVLEGRSEGTDLLSLKTNQALLTRRLMRIITRATKHSLKTSYLRLHFNMFREH